MILITKDFKSEPLAVIRVSNPCLAGICTILPMYTDALEKLMIQAVAEGLDIPEPSEEVQALIERDASGSYRDKDLATAEALKTYRYSFVTVDSTSAPPVFERPDDFDIVIEETVAVYRAETVVGGIQADSKHDTALTALARFALRLAINHAKLGLQKKILEEDFRWSYEG
jgi:hypothetical protein